MDSDLNTALHLAVLNGKTRIVKRLLIRGANRALRNNNGVLPIDIARDMKFERIRKMLDDDYGIKDYVLLYFNMRTKYQPKQRNFLKPALFLFSLLFVAVPSHLLVVPKMGSLYVYGSAVAYALLLVLYLLLLSIQPRILQKRDYRSLAK